MNKIKKLAKALLLIIKKPYLLNTILEGNELAKAEFKKAFPHSQVEKQISLEAIHPMREPMTVAPYSFLSGSSLITDFMLLKLVCMRTNASDYLEIGTWRGESVANVAGIVDNCMTLNLSNDELRSLDLPDNYISLHRFFSEEKSNVTHLFGNSKNFDFDKLQKKWDVIFIDGDHHREAVEADTKRLFPFLKSQNSIMVWHDAKVDTETPRYEVLQGIYSGIPLDKHKNIYLVENTLCAVYIPEQIPSTPLEKFKKPNQSYEVTVQTVKL